MDFEFSEEQEQLRESVRRFLHEQAPMSYVRSMLDDPTGTTPEVWDGLARLGVTGLLVPERHGGMTDMGVVLEEMGRAAHPGPFLSSAVGAVSALVALGDDSLLAGLADGSVVATLAQHDERGSATIAESGAVTGTKRFVPDARAADVLLVIASDDVYAVDAGSPGLVVEDAGSPDGTRKLATVRLDAVAARRVGPVDALAGVVDRLLIAHVVDGLGAASAALDLAVAYSKERTQFGQPIGSFQAVQHLCAEMLQALEMGRAGAYYALWAADEADADEVHRAATMAKAWASDAFSTIGANAIQVFGGLGFTWEHDIHLFYKRLLSLEHTLGGTADHLTELAHLIID